jgi:tetratricopeptide (TPR) repeat protein
MKFIVLLTPEQYQKYLKNLGYFILFIIFAAFCLTKDIFIYEITKKLSPQPKIIIENKENIKSLTQKIKAYPKKVELYTEREKLYLEKKDYLNAIEDLNKQIELQGNSHINTYHCYKRIIKIYTDQRQYQKAIDTYSDLFKCNDYIGKDYTNRGFLYLLTGRVDLALNDFKTASQKRQ